MTKVTRELDSRFTDGIDVRLLWDSEAGQVSVAVSDSKTGDAFDLVVPDNVRALDVFHHPYAYAGAIPAHRVRPGVSLAA